MEINNYKPVNKGCLVAKFDVTIPEWGITIRDCALFEKNHEQWIGMPSRQYQAKDGSNKSFAYVLLDEKIKARFNAACLEKLPKETCYLTTTTSEELLY